MTGGISKNLDKLGSESIPKLVFSFFIIAFMGLMLNTVYSLTDTLFVSWGVGDTAMGGISIVFPFTLIQGAISTTIGGGAAVLVSRKLGEGDYSESGKITINAMAIFYITAVITSIIGLVFLSPILKVLGASEEIFDYAKDYFFIILIGNVFSTGFSSIMRAEGKMLYSMAIWVLPITINIVLDAVFILVLGYGIKGSAIATVISQFCSFLMCVLFFTRYSSQNFKQAKLQFKTIKQILLVGLPSLVQMGSLSILIIIMNKVISANVGDNGVITFGYMSKLITFAIAPFLAITQSISPIVGYNYGEKRYERVKKTTNFCIMISFVFALIILMIAESIPNYLMMVFTNSSDIISMGATGLRIISLSLLFAPLPMIVATHMQAIGKTVWALFLYGANTIFIILPSILMGKYLGLSGIWWSYVIASAIPAVIALAKWLIDNVKKTKVDKNLELSTNNEE